MPKRGRSRSSSNVRYSRRTRTPSSMRRGRLPPSPPATQSRGRTIARGSGSVTRSLSRGARLAARVNPYVNAAMSAYDIGSGVYGAAKSMFGNQTKSKKGAANSKSKGFFGNGTSAPNAFDQYAAKGIVRKLEQGDVLSSQRQVVYAAHSTMPQRQVAAGVVASMLKKLINLAGQTVKNNDQILVDGQYYNSEIHLSYKLKDGAVEQTQIFVVTNNVDTLQTVTSAILAWLNSIMQSANLPGQFLYLRYYVQFGTAVNSKLLQAELDLTNVSFEIYSKSALKLQNRTVNSDGNNEADDVDNVPIFGKFFEYKTNGTIYRDYGVPAADGASAITTHPNLGVLAGTLASDVGTGMYLEVPLPSQFVGCYTHGKAHLDPGEIKTSVITEKITISLQKIMFILFARSNGTGGTGRFEQFWIGKTRLFGFEKMINAVAMSTINEFKLAYEHQLELGFICIHKKINQTAPIIVNSVGPQN